MPSRGEGASGNGQPVFVTPVFPHCCPFLDFQCEEDCLVFPQ